MKLTQYAIYDDKDLPIIVGTAQECADYLGIRKNGIYERITRLKYYPNRKMRKTHGIIVKLDNDDEEEYNDKLNKR